MVGFAPQSGISRPIEWYPCARIPLAHRQMPAVNVLNVLKHIKRRRRRFSTGSGRAEPPAQLDPSLFPGEDTEGDPFDGRLERPHTLGGEGLLLRFGLELDDELVGPPPRGDVRSRWPNTRDRRYADVVMPTPSAAPSIRSHSDGESRKLRVVVRRVSLGLCGEPGRRARSHLAVRATLPRLTPRRCCGRWRGLGRSVSLRASGWVDVGIVGQAKYRRTDHGVRVRGGSNRGSVRRTRWTAGRSTCPPK